MSISIICGACEAKLLAPDAAAGKKVKCRQCGAVLEIPAPEPEPPADYEVVEDAPTMMMPAAKLPPPKPAAALPQPAKAKPKPVELEEADDDRPPPRKKPKPVELEEADDERPGKKTAGKKKPVMLEEADDEDRPAPKKPTRKPAVAVNDDDEDDDAPKARKKLKKKPAAKSNTKLFVGIGGVFGLALVGFLVYWFALREPEVAKGPVSNPNPPGNQGQPAGPPPGWQEFTQPEFSALVHSALPPQQQSLPVAPGIRSGKAYAFQTQNPNGVHVITVITLDDLGTAAARQDPNTFLEAMFAGGAAKSKGSLSARTDSQLDGKPARDAQLQNGPRTMFLRGALDGNRVYMLMADGDGVSDARNEHVRQLFDNFKTLGGDAGPVPPKRK